MKEKFEDTKGVYLKSESKKCRQHNDQHKMDKRLSSKQKTHNSAIQSPAKPGVNSGAPEGLADFTALMTLVG